MFKKNAQLESTERINMTPMIDIVFLLLSYFMVTTTIQKQEGDIGIQLPSDTSSVSDVHPNEAIISITKDSVITFNGQPMDNYESRAMPELIGVLRSFKQAGDISGLETVITVEAHEDSEHQRTIDALNACAEAEIKMVTFAQ